MKAQLAAAALLLLQAASVSASVFNCVGGSVQIVAHPDDDLLFQNPSLLGDFSSNACVTSVFLTSGDSGTTGLTYATGREEGNAAACAYMAGANNSWTAFYGTFGGQPVLVETLTAQPQVQRVLFRLPDGNMDGSGFAQTGYKSLRSLWMGTIPSIYSIDSKSTFTLATLEEALGQILAARQPDVVRSLDDLSDYDGGDHADHLTVGRMSKKLAAQYAPGASFSGYMGYPVQNLPATMSTDDADFIAKCDTFFSYTPYDSAECQSFSGCAGRGEWSWLQREYVVTSALATGSDDGSAETPATLPAGENVALQATATASSAYDDLNPAGRAIDNVFGGYPGNETAEWVTAGEGVGAWIRLSWSVPVVVGGVVVYDRPNTVDWLQAGTLTFDDNSTVAFEVPYNDGTANVVSLARNYTTKSVLLTVTAVASGTQNVGLSELQVYGSLCPSCATTTTTTTTTRASTRTSTRASSTSRTTVSLSPSSASASSSTSTSSSSSASPSTSIGPDLALLATASASSYAAATSQGPEKAIDGVVSGYKADGTGDYTKEWATDHEGAGAWLALNWSSPVTANRVVLYDRPNTDDQILSATIVFSDGSSLAVSALDNAGAATTFDFSTRTFSSLQLTVTSVASTTSNVGLSEVQVYLVSGGASSTSASAPGSTVSRTASASATSSLPSSTSLASSSSASRSTVTLSSSTTQASSASPTPSSTATSSKASSSSSSSSSRTTVVLSSSSTSSSASASPTATLVNYARLADVSASSWAESTDQLPSKAIDGVISGYKEDGTGDYTKEWASWYEGPGAWFGISWNYTITANQVVLYDRPNLNDQWLDATMYFSDGSTLATGALNNDGSATVVSFAAKQIDSIWIQITQVSSTTSSVGLSEIQVYNVPAQSSTTTTKASTTTTKASNTTKASSTSKTSSASSAKSSASKSA
ncbi:hypothetical protein JCM10207_001724 [Rhodosporidiobolus poonsookiae]